MLERRIKKVVLGRLVGVGLRAVEIADQLGCSKATVIRACDAYGLRRPRCKTKALLTKSELDTLMQAHNCTLTAADLAAKLHCTPCTVVRTCRRLGLSKPAQPAHHRSRQKQFDTAFFRRIDTEQKAYVVGFIAADGGLDRRWGCKISIRDYDVDILTQIATALKCTYVPIPADGKRLRLSFYDIDTVRDLAQYGIVERKTQTLPFAKNIPDTFVLSYLRGVFDGDGSIGKSFRLVTGSRAFFTGFVKWYRETYHLKPWTRCEGGTKWRIVFWRKHAQFIHDMYRDATIVSQRRKQAYLKFWSNNDMVRSRKKLRGAALPGVAVT